MDGIARWRPPSHRREAERILVLDQGALVGQGAHDELIARPCLYKEMWEVQRV
ncbi:ABC transporter ATP-binding protein [bacterium]|nr:ABC transporter ATP-binding protein [bacterium]